MCSEHCKTRVNEMLGSFSFLQYYEMSYGLNIEMHKQVSFS